MRRAILLSLFAVWCQVADAREIRLPEMPEAFRGTWATNTDACNNGDKSPIVLSAKSYAGPVGRCVVDYVIEVPGPVYSARMRCSGSAPQTQTIANLVIRPGKDGQISLGPTLDSLAAHRRCLAGGPAK